MPLLTLCMPSNRNLAGSREAIGQALAYCDARDALLVVSDNSGDPEKEKFWRGRSPRMTYLATPETPRQVNFLTAISAAQTPFLLQIGDDDGIAADLAHPTFDLAALPADYMGVRVKIEVVITGHGLVRTKEFAIEGETPSGRMIEYSKKAAGDNSAFYSIFRREPYLNLMKLFMEHHPTKGDYCDWAMVFALFAYGRMAYDPGTVFRYNADLWSDPDKIESRNRELFVAAGLPPDTDDFQRLLTALDAFVFVSAVHSPLSREQAVDAAALAAGALLNGFLGPVRREPLRYSETVRYIADLAYAETDSLTRFQMGLMLADQLKPGLKDLYVAFYRAALGI